MVPLNGLGYFLRTDGSAGFIRQVARSDSAAARIEGYEPIEVVAHDLLARVDAKPALRLTVTNIFNRPIQGKLEVKLGELKLAGATPTAFAGRARNQGVDVPGARRPRGTG